jgi:hypothetical protein
MKEKAVLLTTQQIFPFLGKTEHCDYFFCSFFMVNRTACVTCSVKANDVASIQKAHLSKDYTTENQK